MSEHRRRWMSQLKEEKGKFVFPLPTCSVQALQGLGEACSHQQRQSFLCPPIQMLISHRITLTATTGNILPAIWASLSPVELTHDITIKGSFLKIATYHSYFYLLQTEKTGAKKRKMQTFIPNSHPSSQLKTGASITKKRELLLVGNWPPLPHVDYFINPSSPMK